MFRNRTSSQKPGDELYAHFRANFGNVVGATTSAGASGASSLDAAVNPANLESQPVRPEDIKDLDPTPRAQHDAWRFTPSLLDPSTFTFTNFGNQPGGYYTPTPGGMNTLYHSQAGDLHTPGMGMGLGLGTPLSMPTTEAGVHAGTMMEFSPYSQHMSHHSFQNYNPFANSPAQQHQQPQQQSYAPAAFLHQDTGYETMDHDGSPVDDTSRMGSMDATLQHQSPMMAYQPRQYDMNAAAQLPSSAEKFRYHVVLNAPTAMIKHAEEIPVTYLNKGQAYSVSIVDTTPMLPTQAGTRYRTFVRISFEDEQQRQRPATCWQLWKEGRGTNEAHQRGGKLQAVEYVEASQPADTDDKRTRVELDTASFDGFSVIWTPGVNGLNECNIAVRFNFLSTDFSHSKGVKGIPVRFCAKTEVLNTGAGSPSSVPGSAEVAYCKVKLFRDHGAERKLSNDVQHVKKTIDKLKQQIAQSETGMKDFSKRKRQGSISKQAPSQRPGKVQKHKRTWSMSSASSAGGPRIPLEEDLHFKLQQQQDMFTSTRPVSILYLRGDEQDDPDLHPVALAGEPWDLTKVEPREVSNWQQRSSGRTSSIADTASLVSPSPSSVSLQSQAVMSTSIPTTSQWTEYQQGLSGGDVQGSNPQHLASPPDQVTKVARADDAGGLSGWIEALGVDPSYRPPVERPIKPVACFYVLCRDVSAREKHEYYRAIYIAHRTLQDLTRAISAKWNLDQSTILRTLHILPQGLQVEMDDDVVQEMQEGQDIVMEVVKITAPKTPVKREWEMALDDEESIAESDNGANRNADGYEIRLIF